MVPGVLESKFLAGATNADLSRSREELDAARELWVAIELSFGGQLRSTPFQLRDPVLLDDRG